MLAQLLELDSNVDHAFLCTDRVVQVSKLAQEGAHFCAYRNIQMLWSVLPTEELLQANMPVSTPTVLELQGWIEAAWEAGFNAHGKQLTGGIQNTRKHIGTSEASLVQCGSSFFH